MSDPIPSELRASWEPGMALASALLAAGYGGDSGEDVDRLIAELGKRGYRLQSDADDDAILRSVAEARRDVARSEPSRDPRAEVGAIEARVASALNYLGWGPSGYGDIEMARTLIAALRDEHVALDLWHEARPDPAVRGTRRDAASRTAPQGYAAGRERNLVVGVRFRLRPRQGA